MNRNKAKEKVKYVDKLDAEPRSRYLAKVAMLNGFDPYEAAEGEWSQDNTLIPPLEFPGLISYLVCGVSAYTLDQFKCYKSLEAHMQFTDGWVHELKMFVPNNSEYTVIKAKVLHSQRLNEKPLQPWIILDKSGDVVSAHCDCMAGLAETCTHVGALLFKTEAVVRIRERTTVTGVSAYWMVPSNVEKVRPEVGYRIDYTTASARKKQLDKSINNTDRQALPNPGTTNPVRTCSVSAGCSSTPAPTHTDLNSFLDSLHATGDKAVILSTVPQYCTEYTDPIQPVVMPTSLRALRNTKCDSLSNVELIKHCESLSERVCVSQDEACKMERDTRDQHKTPGWFACRAGRVTASKLHSVCAFKHEKPAVSTVVGVCYPGKQKVATPAVAWGIHKEDEARGAYTEYAKKHHFGMSVSKSGFIVNPDFPCMGASPDAMVQCECCGRGCLEIKCPFKHKDVSIVNACDDSAFCLSVQHGQFSLKKSHPYYTQIQCQMFVSKTEYCDLVVWTTTDFVVTRVQSDESFMAECRQKAEIFFKTVVLPELVAKRYTCPGNNEKIPQKRPICEVSQNLSDPTPAPTAALKGGPKITKSKKKKILWCHCRRSEDVDDMVGCDSSTCKTEWYHVSCVGLDQMPGPDEPWFCSACLSLQKF